MVTKRLYFRWEDALLEFRKLCAELTEKNLFQRLGSLAMSWWVGVGVWHGKTPESVPKTSEIFGSNKKTNLKNAKR